MSVSPSFRTFVLEQLSRLDPGVHARGMFGGVAIYSGDLFFALIDEDILYFKVDDVTRPDFITRGMGPFRPNGPTGETMQYYEVPPDVLEDAEVLRSWVERAVDVARRKRSARSRRRGPRTRKGGKQR
jgi:DNA transformation protein and related proteins